MSRFYRASVVFALCAFFPCVASATPFASNVVLSGTSVSFILNEPADSLTYSINGGPQVALSGAAKGTKSFSLGSPTDKFSIQAAKYEPVGYSIPTGGTVPATANGLSVASNASGLKVISDDTNPLTRYNSPRGVAVSNNPNSGNFGTIYISNSAAGTTTGVVRTLGDGLYAIHSDQSDGYGYGNTEKDPGNKFDGAGASGNSAFRTFVAANGEVYVADFSDQNGNVWRLDSAMTVSSQLLSGVGGPTSPLSVPAGQYHGSTTAVYAEGSSATNNLVLYTVDEDLTTLNVSGAGSNTDKNSLWRYDINGSAVPFAGVPTKVNQTNELIPAATTDMERGADGKFYLMQSRNAGAEAGIVVLDASGVKLFDSLSASRTLLGNPTAADIYRQIFGIAVSPDQKWLATIHNDNTVVATPLVNGIPDIASRLAVLTGNTTISARDIAFDAADNIHYVSSGSAMYRVLTPGGQTLAVTSWDGSSFTFATYVPEPASGTLALSALALLAIRRRR